MVAAPVENIKSRYWTERKEAILAMEKAGKAAATAVLVESLQTDDSIYVRMAAARALGKVGDGKAVQPLIEAMRGDDYGMVRRVALWSLGEIGERHPDAAGKIVPELQRFQADKSWLAERDTQIADLVKVSINRISKAMAATAAPAAAAAGPARTAAQVVPSNAPKAAEMATDKREELKAAALARKAAGGARAVAAKQAAERGTPLPAEDDAPVSIPTFDAPAAAMPAAAPAASPAPVPADAPSAASVSAARREELKAAALARKAAGGARAVADQQLASGAIQRQAADQPAPEAAPPAPVMAEPAAPAPEAAPPAAAPASEAPADGPSAASISAAKREELKAAALARKAAKGG